MPVLADPGSNTVVVGPLWPNLMESVHIMGCETRIVPLAFGVNAWALDLNRLFDHVDDKTTAILINSPSNPTGGVMDRGSQQVVLDFRRLSWTLLSLRTK